MINYIKLDNEFLIPEIETSSYLIDNYNIIGKSSNFKVTPKKLSNTNISKLNYNLDINIDNIYLVTNYIFLDKKEKNYFENNSHKYLINLTQSNIFNNIISSNINVKLNFLIIVNHYFG